MTWRSSKLFDHAFSCAFRQYGATSHCNKLHGYALSVRLDFEGPLDQRNWVVDFGAFKTLKAALEDMFDHKTLVAEDDPNLDWFIKAFHQDILDLRIVPAIGIEAFAKQISDVTRDWLTRVYKAANGPQSQGVKLVKVEVWEHSCNSAVYLPS